MLVKMPKRLLILGPSYRRNPDPNPLPAIERYDGIFYRIARKYMPKDVDIMVMTNDLILIDADTPLPYKPPKGKTWGQMKIPREQIEKARKKNKEILDKKLKKGYSEIFLAMGKQYAEALPNLTRYDIKIIFPATGGPGPKAKALKQWLLSIKSR